MKTSGPEALIRFERILQADRIILYPAGTGATYFHEFLSQRHPETLNRLVGLGDRDPNKQGISQLGLQVYSPEALAGLNPDLVLISSLQTQKIENALRPLLPQQVAILDANLIDEYIGFEAECSALARLAEERRLDSTKTLEHSDWFTCMPVGKNLFTRSNKKAYTFRLLSMLGLPDDMEGQRVLDLGGNDGFYSFECAARGATDIVTLESLAWNEPTGFQRYLDARDMYGFDTKPSHSDIETTDLSKLGSFDTVLCLGLYYHLKNPMGLFDKLAAVTGQTVILSGRAAAIPAIDVIAAENMQPSNRSAAYFVKTSQFPKWLANLHCLRDMFEVAGFRKIETLQYLCPAGSQIASVVIRAHK